MPPRTTRKEIQLTLCQLDDPQDTVELRVSVPCIQLDKVRAILADEDIEAVLQSFIYDLARYAVQRGIDPFQMDLQASQAGLYVELRQSVEQAKKKRNRYEKKE